MFGESAKVGDEVGLDVGELVGLEVGEDVGEVVGPGDGASDKEMEGFTLGDSVGLSVVGGGVGVHSFKFIPASQVGCI